MLVLEESVSSLLTLAGPGVAQGQLLETHVLSSCTALEALAPGSCAHILAPPLAGYVTILPVPFPPSIRMEQ